MGTMTKKAIKDFADIKAASDANAAASAPKKKKTSSKSKSPQVSSRQHHPSEFAQFRPLESDNIIELRPKGSAKVDPPLGTYYAYTKRFDEEIHANELFDEERRLVLQDRLVRFAEQVKVTWRTEIEDIKRFSTMRSKISVTVLIDNSGSLRGEPIVYVAAWMLLLSEIFDFFEVQFEFLGFTTRTWKGGQSRELWLVEGKMPNAGRLSDLRHIVYKSFIEGALGTAAALGVMLYEGVLKENIDGEALLWAHSRLIAEGTGKRLLFALSDGAPIDDSTLAINRGHFLQDHLKVVAEWIEARGLVSLYGIGIGHDVSRYYKNSVSVSDASAVGIPILTALRRAFSAL